MRIEGLVQAGNTSALMPEHTPLLQKGDVVRAAVLQSDGDGVVLRTEDGGVLQARLATEALLTPGDNAELVVTQSTADRLVLRLVLIEPQQDAVTVEHPALKGAATQAASPELQEALRAFAGMEGRPSQQMLARTVQLMREQGLDAKSAIFFAANEIEPTQTAQNALQNLIDGKTAGAALFKLAQSIDAGGQNSAPLASQDGQATAVHPGAANSVFATGNQTAEHAPVRQGQRHTIMQQDGVTPEGRAVPQAEQQAQTPEQIATPQSEVPQQPQADRGSAAALAAGQGSADAAAQHLEKTDIPKQAAQQAPGAQWDSQALRPADGLQNAPRPEHPQNTYAPKSVQRQTHEADIPQSMPPQDEAPQPARTLPEKIASLFARADEGMEGQTVRRAAEEMGDRLTQLQEMVKHADIYDKQTVVARLGDAQAQLKLTQDVSRFLCMQIPVQMQGHETAELYVYRRNRKGGKIDPENTCIVLGIDTQNAGRVEALIRVENRAISIAFSVEKEEAVPAFRSQADELKKAIAGLQYSLTQCSVSRLSEATTPVNAEQTLCAGIKKKHGVSIDYRV